MDRVYIKRSKVSFLIESKCGFFFGVFKIQTGHRLSPQAILILSLRNTTSNYTPHGYQEQKKIAEPYACKCHLFPQEKDRLYSAIKEQKVFFAIKAFQSRN